jgi:hypothetical protein
MARVILHSGKSTPQQDRQIKNSELKMVTKTEVKAVISAPSIATASVLIRGTSPLVIERFSKKAELMEKMATAGAKKKERSARDYDRECEEARYRHSQGWEAVNAASFRSACISACRLVGFKMTIAKMSIFIEQDGLDAIDGLPIVRVYGDSSTFTAHTRNATGVCDIRARPKYDDWFCNVRISWDTTQFSDSDVFNLLARAGRQVGIGAGRPDSKSSAGCGWGTFELVPADQLESYEQRIKDEDCKLAVRQKQKSSAV